MSVSKIEKYGKLLGDWKIKKVLYENRNGTMVLQIYKVGNEWEEHCALKVVPIIEEYGEWNRLTEDIKDSYLEAKMENRHRAEKEVRHMYTMRRCSNIVSYYDYEFAEWAEDNRFGCDLLIRMDLLECLRNCMYTKTFSEKEIVKIGIDICKALVQCHKKDIIHRDIKPENIFINEFGDYLLGDFGISRIVNNAKKASTSAGTFEYMAPEQVKGNSLENYGLTVDIYSLGLTLYELSNRGKLPFAKSIRITQAETELRLRGKALPAPIGVGETLAGIILKACEYETVDRYQSAEEFLNVLEKFYKELGKEKAESNIIDEEQVVESVYIDEYETELAVKKEINGHSNTHPKIVLMGVGGAGNNSIIRGIPDCPQNVKCIAVNTDREALMLCGTAEKLLIGERSFNGMGVGTNHELARKAAKESEKDIRKRLEGVNVLFLVCGMGGGTGTGATPVIARIAKKMGILVIAFAMAPFHFEAKERIENATAGIKELEKYADTLIIIPNQKVLELRSENMTFPEALNIIDNRIWTVIKMITDVIDLTTLNINNIFEKKGKASVGVALLNGPKRTIGVVETAMNSLWREAGQEEISGKNVFVAGDLEESAVSTLSQRFTSRNENIYFLDKESDGVCAIVIEYTK